MQNNSVVFLNIFSPETLHCKLKVSGNTNVDMGYTWFGEDLDHLKALTAGIIGKTGIDRFENFRQHQCTT
jgi:hypothetical protein